jgi:hypothetical protein
MGFTLALFLEGSLLNDLSRVISFEAGGLQFFDAPAIRCKKLA